MRDFVHHHCDNCQAAGKAGNTTRLYEVASPLMVVDTWLCWPCAEKKIQKYEKRKYWSIRDKVHHD